MRRKGLMLTVVVLIGIAVLVLGVWRWKNNRHNVTDRTSKVRVGYQQTILYLPIFVAQEHGYFKSHGVEVELINFSDAPEMMQALLAGQIDATGMSALDVIANVEQEKSGQLKMYLFEAFTPERGTSPDYILAKQGSGIKRLEDLKGKKLGVRPGVTIEMYAKIILKKKGLEAGKDIEIVRLPENLQAQALESGQINALFTFDPQATIILNRRIGELIEYAALAKYLMNEPTTIFPGSGVLSTGFVQKDPATVTRFLSAVHDAVDYITANPQDAKRLLPKFTPITPDTAENVSLVKWVKIKDVDREKVQNLISLYTQNGVLKRDVDLSQQYLSEIK